MKLETFLALLVFTFVLALYLVAGFFLLSQEDLSKKKCQELNLTSIGFEKGLVKCYNSEYKRLEYYSIDRKV